jgi:hypothetical protein
LGYNIFYFSASPNDSPPPYSRVFDLHCDVPLDPAEFDSPEEIEVIEDVVQVIASEASL